MSSAVQQKLAVCHLIAKVAPHAFNTDALVSDSSPLPHYPLTAIPMCQMSQLHCTPCLHQNMLGRLEPKSNQQEATRGGSRRKVLECTHSLSDLQGYHSLREHHSPNSKKHTMLFWQEHVGSNVEPNKQAQNAVCGTIGLKAIAQDFCSNRTGSNLLTFVGQSYLMLQ